MPKRTYQPSQRKKKRKLGFLSKIKTVKGKRIIKRRRLKGRRRLAS
ncbi:50S ribosomal protein L34 [Patescibacteria group bacterium]|nr:50S ribosomal protein L34 [Patescibacteria group bacterium]